jgi:hypothetical protein
MPSVSEIDMQTDLDVMNLTVLEKKASAFEDMKQRL